MSTLDAFQGERKETDSIITADEFEHRIEFNAKIEEGRMRNASGYKGKFFEAKIALENALDEIKNVQRLLSEFDKEECISGWIHARNILEQGRIGLDDIERIGNFCREVQQLYLDAVRKYENQVCGDIVTNL